MRRIILSLSILLLATPAAVAGDLPDPTTTPGEINPAVTQANIHSTICVEGWTKTVRPPNSYTRALKLRQIGPDDDPADFEEDHLIPLAIGGAPRDERNLWPQLWRGRWGAYTKDRLEIKLQHLVCAGDLPLDEARAEMARDWIAAYHRFCPTAADCPSWKATHPDR